MPFDPTQDKDFLAADPTDQMKYLSQVDPDFAKASRGDQEAYLAHVTGKMPFKVPPQMASFPPPAPGLADRLASKAVHALDEPVIPYPTFKRVGNHAEPTLAWASPLDVAGTKGIIGMGEGIHEYRNAMGYADPNKARLEAGAKFLGGAMELGKPALLFGAESPEAAYHVVKGVAESMITSEAGKRAAKILGLSPEAQDFTQAVMGFAPAALGVGRALRGTESLHPGEEESKATPLSNPRVRAQSIRVEDLTPEQRSQIESAVAKTRDYIAAQKKPPEPKPSQPAPVQAPGQKGPEKYGALPSDIKGAKPRYGYGEKLFELSFEDPRDLASYTVVQSTQNKAHDRFMSYLRNEHPGESDAQLAARGRAVRSNIKELAKVSNPEEGPLRIPSTYAQPLARTQAAPQPTPPVTTESGETAKAAPPSGEPSQAPKEQITREVFGTSAEIAAGIQRTFPNLIPQEVIEKGPQSPGRYELEGKRVLVNNELGKVITGVEGDRARVRLQSGKVIEVPRSQISPVKESERGSLSFRPLDKAQASLSDWARKQGGPAGTFERPFNGMKDINDFIDRGFGKITPGQITRGIMREELGRVDLKRVQLYGAFEQTRKEMNTWGPAEYRMMSDAAERKPGAQPVKPELMAVADKIHEEFEVRKQVINNISPDHIHDFYENYYSRIWEKPNAAKDKIGRLLGARKPWGGAQYYTKQRIYQFASEVMDPHIHPVTGELMPGLKPATYNWLDMQIATLHQMDKFIAKEQAKLRLKYHTDAFGQPNPLIKAATGKREGIPDDWVRLSSDTFPIKIQVSKGLFAEPKYYYAPHDAAIVFNNYLNPGLADHWWYDPVRKLGNVLVQSQLGLSGFHGTFSTVTSGVSELARGLQLATRGHPIEAAKAAGRAAVYPLDVIDKVMLGSRIREQMKFPGSHPELQKYVDNIVRGGGRYGLDPFYDNNAIQKFWRAMADHEYFRAMGRSVPAALQKLASPIQRHLVPNLKVAATAINADWQVRDAIKAGKSPDEVTAILDNVVDSMDNRFGQMIYDNYFWKRTYKDLSFIVAQAPGWQIGNIKEIFYGAPRDTLAQIKRISQGQKPELTNAMAFTLALPVVVGATGAMLHKLLTGENPKTWLDYFYPGPKGKKLALASYMKDVIGVPRDPVGAMANKLNPMVRDVAYLLRNGDFYNTQIYTPGDSFPQQAYDVGKYIAKSSLPFSIQNTMKLREAGLPTDEALLSAVGLTPAPSWVNKTKAEELEQQLLKRHYEAGPRTKEEFARMKAYKSLRDKFAADAVSDKDIDAAVKAGMSQEQIYRAQEEAILPSSFERGFARLTPKEALGVWKEATPEERESLLPAFQTQMFRLDPERDADLLDSYQKALE